MLTRMCSLLLAIALVASAQSGPDVGKILNRLDQLEDENHKLLEEIQALRREIAASRKAETSAPNIEERLEVEERRTEEHAQTKVESSQRMPLAITGMLLFNAFHNGRFGGNSQDAVVAGQAGGTVSAGASLRQTVLGLKFDGPDLPGGGKAVGSLYMDFFAGSRDPGNALLHIRTATLDLNWKNTTVTFGQDKPIIAPREPDSLAQVGLSPLTAAGNLWDWNPQVRLEQRFQFAEDWGLRAQMGVYQTSESGTRLPAGYTGSAGNARPGIEGRFELGHGKDHRIEIAPGFHISRTHIGGYTIPSTIVSIDGLLRPVRFFELKGAWFRGENVATLGALSQGFTVRPSGDVNPVHSSGGWAQAAFFPLPRLSFHIYGGQQRDRASDLTGSAVHNNFIYAGNVVYRLAPNVMASFEASQVRTNYLNLGLRLNNHYDLAMAYLF